MKWSSRLATLAVLGLEGGVLGCSSTTCTPSIETGIEVVVTDSVTRKPVCGATVVAYDGAYFETLRGSKSSPENPCSGTYTGADERAGTYQIEVSAAGSSCRAATAKAVVPQRGCHVVPQLVAVTLTAM
jgi:hypothetical protein